MTKYTTSLPSMVALLGVVFSGPVFAANSYQEAWEEAQADVRAQEVIEAPAHIVGSTPWYLQDVKHPYQDDINDVRITGEFDLTPWYFMG